MSGTRSRTGARWVYVLGLLLAGGGAWLIVRCGLLAAGLLLGQNAPPGAPAAMVLRGGGGLILVIVGFAAMVVTSSSPHGFAVGFEPETPHGRAESHAANGETLPGHSVSSGDARAGESGTAVRRRPGRQDRGADSGEVHGPPRPHILVRCPRCRTLNEQRQRACVRCGGPV